MSDTERLDKLEKLLINSEQFANGIGFVPYATIGGAGDVFAVFELREGATVLDPTIQRLRRHSVHPTTLKERRLLFRQACAAQFRIQLGNKFRHRKQNYEGAPGTGGTSAGGH